MYNPSQKEAYVEERGLSPDILPLFVRSERYEELLNKDLCDFTKDEILKWLISCNTTSTALATYVSRFGKYVLWCCENNLSRDGINHFQEVTSTDIKACANNAFAQSKIKSREEVLDYCKMLDDPSDAVLILGCFEGLWSIDSGASLGRLTYDDVNTTKKEVFINGKHLPVSEDFIKYVEKTKEYENEPSFNLMAMQEGNHIIKVRINAKNPWEDHKVTARVRKKIIKAGEKLGITLGAQSLDTSGFIYSIYQRIKENGKIEKGFLTENKYRDIMERYNRKVLNPTKTKELLERYLS